MSALKVDILRKAYNTRETNSSHLVIENLSFVAGAGEFICILGPSGCGKSTLLNLIAGLDKDYEGEISFSPDVKDHLTYMFQTPRLLPWRTVAENIAIVLPGERDLSRRIAGLISEVGLDGYADAYPGQLSLGMQRRAALARAYATRPGILLMDEPFVSLDEAAANRLRTLLIEMWGSRETTILFVTHDSREAVKLGQRLILLSDSPCHVARQIDVGLSSEQREDAQCIEEFRAQNLPAVHVET